MTPEELKELQELEELELLEKQYGNSAPEDKPLLNSIANSITNKAKKIGDSIVDKAKYVGETAADFGRGSLEGLSFGFWDEGSGALKAISGKLMGEKEPLADLYKKYRDVERQRLKEAEERSPIATTVGDIAGGFAPAIVTAGSSLVPSAARIGIRQAAKMGAGQLAKTLGAKAGVLAAEGAIQGIGRSEEEGIPELAEEAYESGKSGVFWGGALGLGGEFVGGGRRLMSNADEIIEDSPFLRQAKMAYEKGKAGESITGGRKDVERMAEKANSQISDIVNRIMKTDEELGSVIGNKIKNATSKGVKISADPAISEAADTLSRIFQNEPDLLGRAETQKVLKELLDLKSSNLTPEGAFELRRRVLELSDNIKDPRMQRVANRFQSSIKQALEDQVEGLAEASEKFKKFREAVPENLISKGMPSEFSSKWYGDIDNKGEKLYNSVDDLLSMLNAPGNKQIEGRITLQQMKKKLNNLVKEDPNIVKQLGFKDTDEFYKHLENVSDEFNLRNMILGYEPQAGFKREARSLLTGDLGTTLRGAAYGSSQLAGKTVKAIGESSPGKFASRVSNMSRNIYKASNEQLKDVAARLTSDPKTRLLGQVLNNALENKGTVGKDAALFSIMQSPYARRFLVDFDFGFDEEEGDGR
jgi:hypothetical protein